MRSVVALISLLIILHLDASSQDSLIRGNREVYSRITYGAFFDVVRTAGISAAWRTGAAFELGLDYAIVYPKGILSQAILANDYFFNHGQGFTLGFKYRPGPDRNFFIGMINSYYWCGYTNQWTEMSLTYDKYVARDFPRVLQDRKTSSRVFAFLLGTTIPLKKFFLEYFFAIGGERTDNYISVHAASKTLPSLYRQPPYNYTQVVSQLNIQTGIKIGFGSFKTESTHLDSYINALNEELKMEESVIDRMMGEGKITSDQYWDGYKPFKDTEYRRLKKEFRKHKHDAVHMDMYSAKVFAEITNYIEQNYGFRCFHAGD